MDPDPDSDPDPAIFVNDLPKMPTKTNKKKSFFAYYFLKVHVHHFPRQKAKRSHKAVGIKVFLTFFAW
jgi:hypothetical protein